MTFLCQGYAIPSERTGEGRPTSEIINSATEAPSLNPCGPRARTPASKPKPISSLAARKLTIRVATPHCRTGQFCARRAKPWVVDWNGDKKPDLLVGDVHDHRTPKNRSNDELRGFVWLYVRR